MVEVWDQLIGSECYIGVLLYLSPNSKAVTRGLNLLFWSHLYTQIRKCTHQFKYSYLFWFPGVAGRFVCMQAFVWSERRCSAHFLLDPVWVLT